MIPSARQLSPLLTHCACSDRSPDGGAHPAQHAYKSTNAAGTLHVNTGAVSRALIAPHRKMCGPPPRDRACACRLLVLASPSHQSFHHLARPLLATQPAADRTLGSHTPEWLPHPCTLSQPACPRALDRSACAHRPPLVAVPIPAAAQRSVGTREHDLGFSKRSPAW